MKSFESKSPGPGTYETSSSFEFRGVITPKAKRFSTKVSLSPGPGYYRSLSPRSTGSTFSKSNRTSLFRTELSPGPGLYEAASLKKSPSYTFSKKYPTKVSNTPGPGTYSYKFITKKIAPAIGKAKRKELAEIPDTPGPGRYESKAFKDTPSWTFSGLKDLSFNSVAPGPGRYEVDSPRKFTCTTPKAKRSELFSPATSPGPGMYNVADIKSPKIKYSIGKAKRPSVHSPTPGPGRYQNQKLSASFHVKFGKEPKRTLQFSSETSNAQLLEPKILKKAPSYTFGLKINKKANNGVPGPGAYNAEKRASSPVAKIGKTFRFIKTFVEKEDAQKPGPGAYEIKSNGLTAKVYISKAKRVIHSPNNNPGPGRYNIA